jgi:hypothetical protein
VLNNLSTRTTLLGLLFYFVKFIVCGGSADNSAGPEWKAVPGSYDQDSKIYEISD